MKDGGAPQVPMRLFTWGPLADALSQRPDATEAKPAPKASIPVPSAFAAAARDPPTRFECVAIFERPRTPDEPYAQDW